MNLATVWPNGTLSFMCAGCVAGVADVAVGPDCSVYVAANIAHTVKRRLTPAGGVVHFLGNGTATSTGDGGPAVNATVNQPYSVVPAGPWAGAVVVAGDRAGPPHRLRQRHSGHATAGVNMGHRRGA
jgi:hypothetical protein